MQSRSLMHYQMVKVATNLDLPIKILWPKSLSFSTKGGFTMLGLGDIVIPGTFAALALRYDHHRYLATSKDTPGASTSYAKPYFYATVFAYVSGLVTTMTVMHVFRAAQVRNLRLLHYVPALTDLAAAGASLPLTGLHPLLRVDSNRAGRTCSGMVMERRPGEGQGGRGGCRRTHGKQRAYRGRERVFAAARPERAERVRRGIKRCKRRCNHGRIVIA
jgi:hypothetical protein